MMLVGIFAPFQPASAGRICNRLDPDMQHIILRRAAENSTGQGHGRDWNVAPVGRDRSLVEDLDLPPLACFAARKAAIVA